MIKSLTVTNYLGDSIKLILARPELSGFIVKDITGIGPGKATINTSEISTSDGSLFNSARVPSRNIVISLQYLWKDSIEDVRQLSYRYFPIKKKVTLTFETDNRMLYIDGYVESNEPSIFSKEEGADISIICAFPFFYSVYGNQTTYINGVEPIFEFPFSNESTTDPLLIMGDIRAKVDNKIVYEGDVETGVVITIHATGTATNITIYDSLNRGAIRIDTNKIETITGSGIINGDDIIISTVKNNKYCKLIRNGKEFNILNCLDRNVSWFQLVKGNNIFVYNAETGASNLQIKIENKVLYEGV